MQTKNHFKYCVAACVFLTVSGCALLEPASQTPKPPKPAAKPSIERPAGPLPPSTRPTYNLMGYPPGSQEGYIDGCESAKGSKWGFKDRERYESDGQYRTGWDDGYAICGKMI
ncbi:hypothetical protein SAMN05216326_102101 [Nitrosomonas marina]|uniref:Lipoprotein n=1 Tax=Nitrosomonas marina TaxID=917 RepID=A0A1H9YPA4_9PROT|nr:hypothetical protein [Nitrosomonas marina]SES70972.1 hypothetical protein SAMN05216326_102101 [Nitrosomonas marina]